MGNVRYHNHMLPNPTPLFLSNSSESSQVDTILAGMCFFPHVSLKEVKEQVVCRTYRASTLKPHPFLLCVMSCFVLLCPTKHT